MISRDGEEDSAHGKLLQAREHDEEHSRKRKKLIGQLLGLKVGVEAWTPVYM